MVAPEKTWALVQDSVYTSNTLLESLHFPLHILKLSKAAWPAIFRREEWGSIALMHSGLLKVRFLELLAHRAGPNNIKQMHKSPKHRSLWGFWVCGQVTTTSAMAFGWRVLLCGSQAIYSMLFIQRTLSRMLILLTQTLWSDRSCVFNWVSRSLCLNQSLRSFSRLPRWTWSKKRGTLF